jgi:D-alanyl-D-alanine dipeptidase
MQLTAACEDLRPLAAAHQPGQRRKPEPVGMVPPQAATELTAQHLVLMAQRQQLGVLGQVRPEQHHQQVQQAHHKAVDERQQHLEMVPVTP